MSVMNGAYKHPANATSIYSQGLRELIDFMMKVDPKERPDIHQVSGNKHKLFFMNLTVFCWQVIERTDAVLQTLN
jgi:hypothetical protein